MKFTKLKPFKIKILIILFLIIYSLNIIHQKFFVSSKCSHLYDVNSFQKCVQLAQTCNITTLLKSYILYRNCVIEYSDTDANYVVFDAVNGLGNRVLGLITVTTYALITSRVLLINWLPGDNHQANFEDLFLPLSKSEQISLFYQYSLSRLASLIKNRWINEIEHKTTNNRIPLDWAFYFDREILCKDKIYYQSWLVHIGFYILNWTSHHIKWIRTDQYFVPLMKRNQKTRAVFNTLFQNGEVFSVIAKTLLHPIPKIDSIIEEFQKEYTLEHSSIITIGIHMRSWAADTMTHIEPFKKCIEHVIHNVSQRINQEITIYLYVISNTRKRRQQLENQISNIYKNLKILNPPEAPEDADTVQNMQYALAQLVLLSKMQHLIITSKSTFGMVAQGLARKGAWIVRQGAPQEPQNIKSNLCEWESTSEPEYQMIESIQINNTCPENDVFLPSIGERTIV